MWIPDDVEAIEQAIARGDLEETASFDGKRELPQSARGNPKVAEIVAAMSTAGGTILYGVGEDENDRLTVRSPITLAGAAERIALIVQTSITEVPHIEFKPYRLPDDPATGFLLVIVPPSPRAPHQLIVGDDRRFYGRGAKGNRRLSEQELALLYARRQQQEVDLKERLSEVQRFTPYVPDDPDAGCVYAFAQPAALSQSLWELAESRAGSLDGLQRGIADAARSVETKIPFDPSFREGAYWFQVGADAWRVSSQPEDPPRQEFIAYLSDITFNIDGRAVLFASNAAQRISEHAQDETGRKVLFERTIAGTLASFFAAVSVFLRAGGYFGAVDVGVAVTNLKGAASVGRHEHLTESLFVDWSRVPTYNAEAFTRTRRLAAASELQDPSSVALALVGRLLAATTGRSDYTPFV